MKHRIPFNKRGAAGQFARMVLFLLATTVGHALTTADVAHNRAVQGTAVGMLREQRAQEARAYLIANLRADAGADNQAMEVAQCGLEIVFQFRQEQKQQLAKDAAVIAFEALRPFLEGRPAPARCAGIFASLGVVCEDTYYDLAAARAYYQAALALAPRDKLTAKRLAQVQARLTVQPPALR